MLSERQAWSKLAKAWSVFTEEDNFVFNQDKYICLCHQIEDFYHEGLILDRTKISMLKRIRSRTHKTVNRYCWSLSTKGAMARYRFCLRAAKEVK